ncbi:MAG TPA: hypothetical protein VGS21_05095 [Acidimicrobiales bacterium]|nr:hypothetical protein [Acidimicrobiales bacterium]
MASPSPLQNRVTPTGDIVVHPSRGLLMGNRGSIHRDDRTLGTTRWRSKMWICCVTDWYGVKRDVMPPGRWTALFFMDEATALSAGHRPCGYCRHDDHVHFGEAWAEGQGLAKRLKASEMDVVLHAERVERTRIKKTRPAEIGSLPDGAMVLHSGRPGLVLAGHVLPWDFYGYGRPEKLAPDTEVELLTPPAIVTVIRAGYKPIVHPSAGKTSLRSFPA